MIDWVIIVLITLISGVGDAIGFIYAAKIWNGGELIKLALLKSAGGFIVGIGSYWIVVKFLHEKNVTSPELQSLYWFCITILGIALISGRLYDWPLREKMVAFVAVVCISWLVYHVE